jgi:signal transduction histidine kinase
VFPVVSAVGEMGALPETGVLLIDVSREVFLQNVRQERAFLTYLNSALSHEMRNPLNGIFQHVEIMGGLAVDLSAFKVKVADRLTEEELAELEDIAEELACSAKQCRASSQLLKFNVEDIVALPQIKDGRLRPAFRRQDARALVRDVLSVQEQQTIDKGIAVDVALEGFGATFEVPLDTLRFQQVLLNFYSNAIKYLDRPRSRILVLVQLVRPAAPADLPSEHRLAVLCFVDKTRTFFETAAVLGLPERGRCPSPQQLREAGRNDLVDIF